MLVGVYVDEDLESFYEALPLPSAKQSTVCKGVQHATTALWSIKGRFSRVMNNALLPGESMNNS